MYAIGGYIDFFLVFLNLGSRCDEGKCGKGAVSAILLHSITFAEGVLVFYTTFLLLLRFQT
jgi:hypothetical protein